MALGVFVGVGVLEGVLFWLDLEGLSPFSQIEKA